jgi:hypothetical protein
MQLLKECWDMLSMMLNTFEGWAHILWNDSYSKVHLTAVPKAAWGSCSAAHMQ